MSEVLGLVTALVSGGALVGVAFVNGWIGRGKAKAETDSTNTANLIKQLEWHIKEIDRLRTENTTVRSENDQLHKDLHDERESCAKEIKILKKEMEQMRQTISQQGIQISELKSKYEK